MVETTKEVVTNKIVARGRVAGFGRDYQGRREIYLYIRGAYQERPINVSFTYRDLDPTIEKGDFIEVVGHAVSYFRRPSHLSKASGRNERSTLVQYFVADKMTKLKTEIEEVFGVDGGFSYGRTFFRIYISGEVASVRNSEGSIVTPEKKSREVTFTRISVRTPATERNRRMNLITAQFTSRMRVADVPVNVGDKVVIVANLSSNKKNFNNEGRRETVYFMNLIIDDMVVTEFAPPSDEPVESQEQILPEEPKKAEESDKSTVSVDEISKKVEDVKPQEEVKEPSPTIAQPENVVDEKPSFVMAQEDELSLIHI